MVSRHHLWQLCQCQRQGVSVHHSLASFYQYQFQTNLGRKYQFTLWSLGSHLHPAGAWSQADNREQLSHKLASVAHRLRPGDQKLQKTNSRTSCVDIGVSSSLSDDAKKASFWCPTGPVQTEDVTNPWPCEETKTWLSPLLSTLFSSSLAVISALATLLTARLNLLQICKCHNLKMLFSTSRIKKVRLKIYSNSRKIETYELS